MGFKTRAMLETVHREGEKQKDTGHQQMPTNPEATKNQQELQDHQGAMQSPTVHLTRIEIDDM